MARVPTAGTRPLGSAALDRTRTARKKKPYKVVMEMVTQQKKKLRSTMAYSKHAPRGYTFVPLGNRDLTEDCKEQCRKKELVAHIVSARAKADSRDPVRGERNRIDTQRVGHHFPDVVVNEACRKLHYHHTRKGFSKYRPAGAIFGGLQHFKDHMFQHGRQCTEMETKEQIRSAMLEVFPKIPQTDLEAIVRHAFEEGTQKVGNAKDLPMSRRVQLAVGAYVRHQYTDYDALLKRGVPWLEARRQAEPVSYAKLLEWRDEANNPELEEIFREIIVLDDDDDDEGEDHLDESTDSFDSLSDDKSRESSFEIVSSRATGRELQPDLADVSRSHTGSYHPRAPDASGDPPPYPVVPSTHAFSSAVPTQSRLTQQYPDPYSTAPGRAFKQAPTVQMIDGQLYELQPIDESHSRRPAVTHPPFRTVHRPDQGGYIHAPPQFRALDNVQTHRSAPLATSRHLPEDIPLPSVERDSEPSIVPRHMEDVPKTRGHDTRLIPVDYRGLEQVDFPSPKRSGFHPPTRDVRVGQPESAYSHSRPAVYDDLAPSRSSQMLMPYQLPTREPVRVHDRFRRHPEQNSIDLTMSPLGRSYQDRGYYVPTSASSFAAGRGNVCTVLEPRRGLPSYAPEYRAPVVYTPQEDEAHLRAIRSRYVETDIRRSSRGGPPSDGRAPR